MRQHQLTRSPWLAGLAIATALAGLLFGPQTAVAQEQPPAAGAAHRNLMLVNAESRWALWSHLDAAAFFDAGGVAARAEDLGFDRGW